MILENFCRYEMKRVNGENQIYLYLNVPSGRNDTEFSSEFGLIEDSAKNRLQKMAAEFVKRKIPSIKLATVVIVAGSTILSSFHIQSAEAHEVDFNMSYLYFGNSKTYISEVDQTNGNLSLVSPSYFDLNANGSLKISTQFDPAFVKEMHNRGIKVVPFLSNHWDRNVGRAALENREELSTQIADFVIKNNVDGVHIDIENVTEIDRDNYTDLVRLLDEKLPNKEVSIAVAANPYGWTKGWHGSYDYKSLAKYTDYLMVMAYDQSYEGSPEGPVASYGWVEKSIQYALNQGVPSEKIVLGVPFYGRYWKEGDPNGGIGISNKQVDVLLSKYGGQVVFDKTSQSPKATITIKQGDPTTTVGGKILGPGTYHIWYENADSIKAKLQLLHQYGLKGSGSWSLGQESNSIWQNYRSWLSHDGLVNVKPVVSELPKEQTGTVSSAPTSVSAATVKPTEPKVIAPLPTPATPKPTPATNVKTYTVVAGDSLSGIAKRNNTTVDALRKANNLKNDIIRVNQKLTIPTTTVTPAQVTKPAAVTAQKTTTSATTVMKTYPTLKQGSKGVAVANLQTKLKKLGLYKGRIDSSYGPATKSAVIAFQKKYKIKADGIAGPPTLSKLEAVVK